MRALNMQALTNDIQKRYPGVIIYGIGDAAHKLRVSDHNEDDTPGSKAEQSDADNVPEHRAIDIMLGAKFPKSAADLLVANLTSDPAARRRMHYVIFNTKIYTRENGWASAPQVGDQHTDHVHVSGWAADDENAAHWPAVDQSRPNPTPPPSTPQTIQKGDSGQLVKNLQTFLRNTFPVYRSYVPYMPGKLLVVDSAFGDQTVAWVKEFQRRTSLVRDGVVGPLTWQKLRQYGYRW